MTGSRLGRVGNRRRLSSRTMVTSGCDARARGDLVGKPLAIHGERGAGRHAARLGGAHHERAEPPHLFLQEADRVIELVAAERVAADQLREAVGLVHGRRADGPHFVQRDRHPPRGRLPGGFRTGEPAADDGDHDENATTKTRSHEEANRISFSCLRAFVVASSWLHLVTQRFQAFRAALRSARSRTPRCCRGSGVRASSWSSRRDTARRTSGTAR